MSGFRLLTKHPLLLVDAPEGLEERLRKEGYDTLACRTPKSLWSFLRLALRIRRAGPRCHVLLAARLSAPTERIWRLFLRAFPFLVASLTRYDDPNADSLDQRLKKLAERDYKETAPEGRHHDSASVQQRSSARARTEFDHLLETPHP